MLTLNVNHLPKELLRLPQIPKQLFCSNDSLDKLLKLPRIGIVGSRKVSPYGRAVTTKFANELAGKGVVVLSGLALGVDSIAHSSALQAGGTTIAVLPNGLDKIYPASHTQLAHQITQCGGLLVTEYPRSTEPRREHFIARNRIIAALSEGLLITEAAVASGSLHTARFALELGIPVLAVPGPITSPTSEGTNNLIKAGAVPVTCLEDIFNALKWRDTAKRPVDIYANTEPERIILELLRSGISDGHKLLTESSLDAASFNQALTMLEITGRIRPLGNNFWALA
jgi:DNA processing protein